MSQEEPGRNRPPKRPCARPGCPRTTRARYCPQCQERLQTGTAGSWAREREQTTTERGYGHAWRKIRKRIAERDHHLCQPCQRAGRTTVFDEVDHIVPKARGGTDDDANLECICRRCHREKTARES